MTRAALEIPYRQTQEDTAHYQSYYDARYATWWFYMGAWPRPCFSPRLLREARRFQMDLVTDIDRGDGPPVKYVVLASRVPGVFNLGGDLDLFQRLIDAGDEEGLRAYALACLDIMYPFATGLERGVTTLSLVQGDALGGGFESALSAQVLIAERSARMGLPEILFNLFPGMGAASLLSRKLDPARAEALIRSGKVFSAEELYAMGVVDRLVDDGQGERAVYDYIRDEERHGNGYRALRQAMSRVNPLTYGELVDIAEIWVQAALRLERRDLRMMQRLVSKQNGRSRQATAI